MERLIVSEPCRLVDFCRSKYPAIRPSADWFAVVHEHRHGTPT
jgi:hypothetical protein